MSTEPQETWDLGPGPSALTRGAISQWLAEILIVWMHHVVLENKVRSGSIVLPGGHTSRVAFLIRVSFILAGSDSTLRFHWRGGQTDDTVQAGNSRVCMLWSWEIDRCRRHDIQRGTQSAKLSQEMLLVKPLHEDALKRAHRAGLRAPAALWRVVVFFWLWMIRCVFNFHFHCTNRCIVRLTQEALSSPVQLQLFYCSLLFQVYISSPVDVRFALKRNGHSHLHSAGTRHTWVCVCVCVCVCMLVNRCPACSRCSFKIKPRQCQIVLIRPEAAEGSSSFSLKAPAPLEPVEPQVWKWLYSPL